MKVYKLELLVYDFEDRGLEETKELLENSRHLDLKVVSSEAVDIGEWDYHHPLKWDDDNPLNKEHWKEEYKRLFNIKD